MWFRNLQIFRLGPDWAYSTDALAAALQTRHLPGLRRHRSQRARLGAAARRGRRSGVASRASN
jgi:DNA recombination-dependent growth factor C